MQILHFYFGDTYRDGSKGGKDGLHVIFSPRVQDLKKQNFCIFLFLNTSFKWTPGVGLWHSLVTFFDSRKEWHFFVTVPFLTLHVYGVATFIVWILQGVDSRSYNIEIVAKYFLFNVFNSNIQNSGTRSLFPRKGSSSGWKTRPSILNG